MTAVGGPPVATGWRRARRDPALWSFVAMVALAAVQTVVLDVGAGPLRAAIAPASGALAVLVGRVARVPEEAGQARRWLHALGAAEVVLALWALQAFLRALPSGIGEPSGFYRVKLLVTTPLGDHNTVAGFLLVGIVVAIVLAHEDTRWWVAVAVTTAGFVACLSRGAAVVLLAVALGSWLVGTRRRVALTLTATGVVALGVVSLGAVVLDASPPPGAEVPDGPIGTSVLGRVDLVVRGFEVFAQHPVLGVGRGGFPAEARDLPLPNDHAHNAFTHAAAEGGVPQLVLTSAVVLLLAWRAWRRPPPDVRGEVALLGGGALALHAQIDVLGGLLGTELLLGALLVLVAPRPSGAASSDGLATDAA